MNNINILWLYSDLLDLYGDSGNLTAIKYQLQQLKVEYNIDQKNIYDEIDFSKYQLIYCGPGKDKNLLEANKHLIKYRKQIKDAIENNTIFLINGNAQLLFGKEIKQENEVFEALGIFDYSSRLLNQVFINDYVCTCQEIEGKIYGFINRTSVIEDPVDNYLFDVIYSQKPIGIHEGVHYRNYFGSWALGPVLAKNPNYLSYILSILLNKQIKIDDQLLNDAYNKTLAEFENK